MTTALVPPPRRIAIVHDWLDTWRGGENVLAEVLALYPDATLFSFVDFLPDDARARIAGRRAGVTFLQRMPASRRRFRGYLPLFPRAIESLDLSGHDLVISISHAVAKGVRKPPGALHVCYCLTPMRYAWDLREAYLATVGGRVKRALVNHVLDRLRDWDRASASGVDRFAGISSHIVERIGASYGREAAVVYPPVDVDYFSPGPVPARRRQLLPDRIALGSLQAHRCHRRGVPLRCPSGSWLLRVTGRMPRASTPPRGRTSSSRARFPASGCAR